MAMLLLVEDDEFLQHVLARVLEAAGYDVLSALTGPQAVAQLSAHAGNVDLVITDLGLPGIGGSALLTELRRIDRSVPVLTTSGYLDAPERFDIPLGEVAFLPKPFTSAVLLTEIAKLLAQRSGR